MLKQCLCGVSERMQAQISRYIQLKTCVCLGLGVAMGIFLWSIGVASPAFFGVLSFLVNFIPNFGPPRLLPPLPTRHLAIATVPFSLH